MRRIYIILLIIMLFVLTGCGTNFFKDEKCDAYLEQSIEAIVAGDKEAKTYSQCTYRVVTMEETYNVLIVRVEDKEGLDAMSRFYFEKNYEK